MGNGMTFILDALSSVSVSDVVTKLISVVTLSIFTLVVVFTAYILVLFLQIFSMCVSVFPWGMDTHTHPILASFGLLFHVHWKLMSVLSFWGCLITLTESHSSEKAP
ncbi:hypothetical protein NL108_018669 [Boleophthalmus pectinirostris]|nr:hypothetical protein NL108_018669 [Boleophthalmus pectinirostris]